MTSGISAQQWAEYERDGVIRLGKVLSDEGLAKLQKRIDQIMLGQAKVNYDRMLMQLDSTTGAYEDAGVQSRGHKGARLDYRKIQELEFDPLFLEYMQLPIFREICRHVYGDVSIACFRAMFFNKPSNRGTMLPWHQDRWNYLDKDPLITVWSALDPSTKENGCVQYIPGSHRRLINPSHLSGFLTPEQAAVECPDEKAEYLELKPGEVALLHNWVCHRSDVNRTAISRRAFSVCYMSADTKAANGETYSTIFGPGALSPAALLEAAGV
ncbi:MAG: phytanoyl-CoA dioxygenase family protein [Phycisphaeraceae bacterium]|nr:phytanoyl-CoA dioxygenase family protein [Phycisphaeraceae bacterium]